ncbi:hypothetical protein GGR57DRAFT_150486 [Xylariaceae sp. FL1272]|nr:hypothetical protein GGR57DRAFT_150486 [Xylariaceae sp. FL1272]
MSTSQRFRPRIPPLLPADCDNNQKDSFVAVYHPAYPASCPPLLRFVAVDLASDGQTLGIDYDVAKAACGIIANNRWDDATYIATKARASASSCLTKVDPPEGGVLPALPRNGDVVYYFVVENGDNLYPVVPTFDHWRFPHGIPLPTPWNSLEIRDSSGQISGSETDRKMAARLRDRSCRVTAAIEACEAAHIIPYAEHEWFQSNDMVQYCRLSETMPPIDDEANLITLRADIHTLFDQHRFVLLPKTESPGNDRSILSVPPSLVLHTILPRGSRELSQFYHNRLAQPIAGIAAEFLFARFALAILRDEVYSFFSGGTIDYAVCLYDKETGIRRSERLSRDAVRDRGQLFYSSSGRVRSVSPKKRKAPSANQQTGDSIDDFTVMECRGRPRFRNLGWSNGPHSPADLTHASNTFSSSCSPFPQEIKSEHVDRGSARPYKRAKALR